MSTQILPRRQALSLLVVVVLAWGFTWVVSKLLLQYMTPIWAVAARSVAGAAANAVPYKSQPPAVTDLLGGHVDYLFADLSVVTSFMHSGKLKGIAFTGQARSKDFPDVPTLAELGYRNFDLVVWVGVAAPKDTPAPVVERLNREITRILSEPDSIAKFETLGMQVAPNTLAEHQAFAQSQRQIWTQRAIDAKIEPQ